MFVQITQKTRADTTKTVREKNPEILKTLTET